MSSVLPTTERITCKRRDEREREREGETKEKSNCLLLLARRKALNASVKKKQIILSMQREQDTFTFTHLPAHMSLQLHYFFSIFVRVYFCSSTSRTCAHLTLLLIFFFYSLRLFMPLPPIQWLLRLVKYPALLLALLSFFIFFFHFTHCQWRWSVLE